MPPPIPKKRKPVAEFITLELAIVGLELAIVGCFMIIFTIGISLVRAVLIRAIWNFVIPDLGGPSLTFWQTCALMLLVSTVEKQLRK